MGDSDEEFDRDVAGLLADAVCDAWGAAAGDEADPGRAALLAAEPRRAVVAWFGEEGRGPAAAAARAVLEKAPLPAPRCPRDSVALAVRLERSCQRTAEAFFAARAAKKTPLAADWFARNIRGVVQACRDGLDGPGGAK